MARKLDKIVVVDVEATCWEGKPPEGQESEIIEIGICLLDIQSLERSGKRSIFVKPERSQISEFCISLTTISPEDVENAISFREACKLLEKEYQSKNRVWASFGAYDMSQFQRQCLSFQIPYPFGPSHVNVKTLFALKLGLKFEVGMAGALEKLKLPLEGTHHRGDDDAWNIAAVLAVLLERM